jgi:hypothetical protein
MASCANPLRTFSGLLLIVTMKAHRLKIGDAVLAGDDAVPTGD